MRDSGMGTVRIGTKRKRVVGTNENAHVNGRPTRGSGRLKRLKGATGSPQEYTSDEEISSMEVDIPTRWTPSDESELEEEESAQEDEDSSQCLIFT